MDLVSIYFPMNPRAKAGDAYQCPRLVPSAEGAILVRINQGLKLYLGKPWPTTISIVSIFDPGTTDIYHEVDCSCSCFQSLAPYLTVIQSNFGCSHSRFQISSPGRVLISQLLSIKPSESVTQTMTDRPTLLRQPPPDPAKAPIENVLEVTELAVLGPASFVPETRELLL